MLPVGTGDGVLVVEVVPIDAQLLQPPLLPGLGLPVADHILHITCSDVPGAILTRNHKALNSFSKRLSSLK